MLTNWEIYTLDLDGAIAGGWPHSEARRFPPAEGRGPPAGPMFYMGTLKSNGVARDTFLQLKDWSKVRRRGKGFDVCDVERAAEVIRAFYCKGSGGRTIQSFVMKKH